jgi:Na+:H+ antiporter, NhaA family
LDSVAEKRVRDKAPPNREPTAAPIPPRLPQRPVERLLGPLARFLRIESASGLILLLCTLVALAVANSPWAAPFHEFWHTHIRVGVGSWEIDLSLLHWVNDGLMAIFFFVVGLEIKRELVDGELSEWRKAALPVVAALGGMVAPALIYLILPHPPEARAGWGIPMATDIAFVVGFLALLGPRVPSGLKILLLSLAIADDIGAVLVIAVAYTSDLNFAMLGLAAGGFALIVLFNRRGVRSMAVYALVGAAIWLGFLKSGVHPTVAGVVLGLLTPARPWLDENTVRRVLADAMEGSRAEDAGAEREETMAQVAAAARAAISPLKRLETALHPWVSFVIMPVFALGNAGVALEPGALGQPVALAVAAGLLFGKPLGIVLFSWLAVRAGFAALPAGVNWRVMIGAGCLAGIGFTMALFIAGLALPSNLLDAGKIGILTGSLASAVIGSVLLVAFLQSRRNEK